MPIYLVTFVIQQDQDIKDYNTFFAVLEHDNLPHKKLSSCAYAVKSDGTASALSNRLATHLQAEDTIVVIRLDAPHASNKENSETYKWIKNNLPPDFQELNKALQS